MELTPACQHALSAWLNGNWTSILSDDSDDFSRFVEQYASDHGLFLNKDIFVKTIVRTAGASMHNDAKAAADIMEKMLGAKSLILALDAKQKGLEAELDAMVSNGSSSREVAAKAKEYTAAYWALTEEALRYMRPVE